MATLGWGKCSLCEHKIVMSTAPASATPVLASLYACQLNKKLCNSPVSMDSAAQKARLKDIRNDTENTCCRKFSPSNLVQNMGNFIIYFIIYSVRVQFLSDFCFDTRFNTSNHPSKVYLWVSWLLEIIRLIHFITGLFGRCLLHVYLIIYSVRLRVSCLLELIRSNHFITRCIQA